jgi:hypothetical protein
MVQRAPEPVPTAVAGPALVAEHVEDLLCGRGRVWKCHRPGQRTRSDSGAGWSWVAAQLARKVSACSVSEPGSAV